MIKLNRSLLIVCTLVPLIGLAPASHAMGTDPAPPAAKAVDADYAAGRKAIDAKDWPAAIQYMQRALAKDARNADAYNWLGYAQRNSGDYDSAFKSYARALELEPRHKGAHEYIGEAYLKVGNLKKAQEHLSQLDRICTFGCAEYTELKNKIAAFRDGKSS